MTRSRLDTEHFYAQFHNHDHYIHHEPNEHRSEWWELADPREKRATGGSVRRDVRQKRESGRLDDRSVVGRALQLTSKGPRK